MTLEPEIVHGVALDAIQFRVVFPLGAEDTARGDYRNASPGVVQPMLQVEHPISAEKELLDERSRSRRRSISSM